VPWSSIIRYTVDRRQFQPHLDERSRSSTGGGWEQIKNKRTYFSDLIYSNPKLNMCHRILQYLFLKKCIVVDDIYWKMIFMVVNSKDFNDFINISIITIGRARRPRSLDASPKNLLSVRSSSAGRCCFSRFRSGCRAFPICRPPLVCLRSAGSSCFAVVARGLPACSIIP
jgi:hypothetical protein